MKGIEHVAKTPGRIEDNKRRRDLLAVGTCTLITPSNDRLPCPQMQFVVNKPNSPTRRIASNSDGLIEIALPDAETYTLEPAANSKISGGAVSIHRGSRFSIDLHAQ